MIPSLSMKRKAVSREGMTVTSVALPQALHRRLMIASIEDNAAAAELVREAVERYLETREKKTGRSSR